MIYQIVSPIVATIEGDSFKEAIKNYVKFNHNLNIRNLIVKDQADHAYEARLRYYMENQKNKVGIDVYPYTNINYPVIAPINPVIAPINPVIAPINPIIAPINPVIAPINPVIAPINPVIAPMNSLISSLKPFYSNSIPTYIKTPAVVSAPNSRFFATDSNIFIKNPYY
jgi:hypothetical protein